MRGEILLPVNKNLNVVLKNKILFEEKIEKAIKNDINIEKTKKRKILKRQRVL